MKREIAILESIATEIQGGNSSVDFRSRVVIERAVFVVAKAIAEVHLGHDLQSLTKSEVELITGMSSHGGRESELARFCVWRAIELRAALSALASGDPYRTTDLAGPSFPGRKGAIRAFAIALNGFTKRSSQLLADITA